MSKINKSHLRRIIVDIKADGSSIDYYDSKFIKNKLVKKFIAVHFLFMYISVGHDIFWLTGLTLNQHIKYFLHYNSLIANYKTSKHLTNDNSDVLIVILASIIKLLVDRILGIFSSVILIVCLSHLILCA